MNSLDLFGNPNSSSTIREETSYTRPNFLVPLAELEDQVEEDQRPTPNLASLYLIILACATILGSQCFRLQITQGSTNRSLAEGNSVRLITVPADRGLIEDSHGTVLAQNSRQLALAINPQELPVKHEERLKVYQQLQKQAEIDDKTIALIENNRKESPDVFAIKTNLSKDESLLYKEWFATTPGVVFKEIPIRQYTNFSSMGHVIGYVGPVTDADINKGRARDERIGKTGLEKQYDNILTGKPGKKKAEVNAFGEEVRDLSGSQGQPVPGKTIQLNLDLKLQDIVATALRNELDRRKQKFGDLKELGASAVVLDPNTGAVKAMVSLPDYDGQKFAQGISNTDYDTLLKNPANPLLNRATQGQYPSGSVIKPLIAGAALQAGNINEKFQVVTPEAIYVGDFRFPDWKVHGQTDIRKAIAESNDIFFYALGGGWQEKKMKGLGIDGLNTWLAKYNLGTPTGIDIPSEESGLLAGPEWKEKNVGEPWYIGDTYHASIGQGYTLVTPLQMAVSTAAIANGGTVYKPSIARVAIDVLTGEETQFNRQVLAKDFISPNNLKIVREGMRQTVVTGSARPLNGLKVASAGKTGTAEFGNKGLTHAWYTGFAPYDKPELVFSILIEGGGESFYSSVPVAEEILRGYFNEPLQPGQQLNASTNEPLDFQGEH